MAQSTYSITVTNNGSGVYTPLVQRGGTPASGGTDLPGGGSNLLTTSTSTSVANAIYSALVVVADDRAAGN